MNIFTKAKREAIPLRIATSGPSGAGKTVAALRLAYGLAAGDWGKVFLIQTETRANALSYVNTSKHNIGEFLWYQLDPPCTPERLVRTCKAAEAEGAQVLIIDSFSHVWAGRGGVREIHDRMDGNPWTNWDKVNPRWFSVLDYLNYECEIHVILTVRAKIKHVQEIDENTGRSRVRVLGMDPIIRPETEYEFPLWFVLDRETYRASVMTMRGEMLGEDFDPAIDQLELTEDVGRKLAEFSNTGTPWLSGLPYGLVKESPNNGEANEDEGGKDDEPACLPIGDFWKVIYRWAEDKRLTNKEARDEGLRLLGENDMNPNITLPLIVQEWSIPDEKIPAGVIDIVYPGHAHVLIPATSRQERIGIDADQDDIGDQELD